MSRVMGVERVKKTKIIYMDPKGIDDEKLAYPARLLRQGDTVVFPTETVYGLGADALSQKAVGKIFVAKGRPADNPLIVHIADRCELEALVKDVPETAEALMAVFWPGPLTMIFRKSQAVPEIVTAGLDTVAVRMPSHPLANKLIKMARVPVAAPSANLSGKPSPTREEHVLKDLFGKVDCIVCGGETAVGLESTVLDITGKVPVILRPGGVTRDQIASVAGDCKIDEALLKADSSLVPKSPGMKYTHYSPDADVLMAGGDGEEMVGSILREASERKGKGQKVGILATDENMERYREFKAVSLGSRQMPEEIASRLFMALRLFDEMKMDVILSETIEEEAIGRAVMNRLKKAAGNRWIERT